MQFSHNFSMTFDNVLGKKYRFFYMGIAILWIVGYHLYIHDIDFMITISKLLEQFLNMVMLVLIYSFFLSLWSLLLLL